MTTPPRQPPTSVARAGQKNPAAPRIPLLPFTTALILLLAAGCTHSRSVHQHDRGLQTRPSPDRRQVDFVDHGWPVLRYNHQTIAPGEALQQVSAANRIYAVPRSDYIHPLYGPSGEELTRDWSPDHPHHRGIYWAWPEVTSGGRQGDLHALQHIFAHPEGTPRLISGPSSCAVIATNTWRWNHTQPVVREVVTILAHAESKDGRALDLRFEFSALSNEVSLARRDTRLYGGLNLRLQSPRDQQIVTHTDPESAAPRRAWSDLSGVFHGTEPSGITVLQHRDNPGFPADWIQYPELAWCQPAFPTVGTRHVLRPGEPPLVLRYRLFIHPGPTPHPDLIARIWDDFHHATRSHHPRLLP